MIYVSTHAGKRHTVSEDAVLVGNQILTETSGTFPVPQQGFVSVADGVGGNRGGAKASQFVLKALAECNNTERSGLKDFLTETNQALIEVAAKGDAPDMATTLTGLLFSPEGIPTLIHIGNTRAYIKQGRYLKQITSDHTTYNWLVSSGQHEAAEKYNKSEITNCFGGKNPVLLSKLYISAVQEFSLALLTSDGIHEYVDLDTLEDIVSREGTIEEKCEEMIRTAVEAGSEDDLTAVIICPVEE